MRAIDADALMAWIKGSQQMTSKMKCVIAKIETMPDAVSEWIPSIDIEPKRGEWIPCTKGGLPLTELSRREGQKWYGYKCSKCNFIYKGNALTESPFCQNCGTNMKGMDDVV